MPDALTDALELVTAWAGSPVAHTVIKGGLSHIIARVDSADGRHWLLRVLDPRISEVGLGIPLDQEIVNTVRAAESGVGAKVLCEMPGALLLEYIEGRTLDIADVRDPALVPAIGAACRRLHRGPRFANDFSIFRKLDELLALCRKHGLTIPGGYEDYLSAVGEIEEALGARPPATVPCHNDLLAQNLLLEDRRIRIIDYQLSGNNDPAFELGDMAAEADYDPDQVARLAQAYLGGSPRSNGVDLTARVRLNLIMSNITWTLWFAVHHGLLQPSADFDYEAEADNKFAQAVRDVNDRSFGRLIDAVQRRHHAPPPVTRKEAP
jgi:thiamine kinase-like enzyme